MTHRHHESESEKPPFGKTPNNTKKKNYEGSPI